MGIYDRDYYQQENRQQGTPVVRRLRNTSVTNKLLIANIVVHLVCWIISDVDTQRAVYDFLAIPNDFFEFDHIWQIWRPISHGFMHAPLWNGSWHILMNGFGLWMFGRFIEQRYGSSEFLRFYLLSIIFSGLVFVVTNLGAEPVQAIGASGGVVAIVILFRFLYPHEKVLIYGIIPMPAWLMGLLFVALDIFNAIGQSKGIESGIAWQAHLGGAAFATAYYLLKWDFSFLGRLFSSRKPKLTVYRDEDSSMVVNDELSAENQLIAQGEEILKQVHEQGQSSLSSRQRKTLERYSELLQQRRGRDDGSYRF